MSTTIKTITGSILDDNIAEGIAVFVQEEGKYKPHFQKAGWRFLPTPDVRMQPLNKGIAKYLICLDNERVHGVESVDDMRAQVVATLDAFAKESVKTIAMNGIRCDDRPDPNIRPEAYQRQYVEEYVAAHPDAFDTICLVDLHGGFKHCCKNSITLNTKQRRIVMPHDNKNELGLEKMFNEYVKQKDISSDKLEYKWPPQRRTPNEKEVIKKFTEFKRDLDAALDRNSGSDEKIKDCLINIVSRWGHVKLPRNGKYCKRYLSLLKELHARKNNFSSFVFPRTKTIFCRINPLCPISYINMNDPLTRLSAWTKVLAAYDNKRFWIYDSRVAIALSFLYKDINWYIPQANDRNGEHPQLVNIINEINHRREGTTILSPEDSYCLYLRRMGETQDPCHIEKQLFMLGGFLGDMCVDRENAPNFDVNEFEKYWNA